MPPFVVQIVLLASLVLLSSPTNVLLAVITASNASIKLINAQTSAVKMECFMIQININVYIRVLTDILDSLTKTLLSIHAVHARAAVLFVTVQLFKVALNAKM